MSASDAAFRTGYNVLPIWKDRLDPNTLVTIYAAYDQRTDQFGHFGKQYGTKPGFYLLVGPNWNGTAPEGISDVMRSSTKVASIVPPVFMNDTEEDRKAIQGVIEQIVVYPLDQFDGKMKTVEWNKLPVVDDTESNWLPAPDGDFSLYIRAYWGKAPIIDGSWQPTEVATVK